MTSNTTPGHNSMIHVRNVAKERLEAGELALGIGLRQARTVDIGKAMRTAGYDFIFIDMEHNSMSQGAYRAGASNQINHLGTFGCLFHVAKDIQSATSNSKRLQ